MLSLRRCRQSGQAVGKPTDPVRLEVYPTFSFFVFIYLFCFHSVSAVFKGSSTAQPPNVRSSPNTPDQVRMNRMPKTPVPSINPHSILFPTKRRNFDKGMLYRTFKIIIDQYCIVWKWEKNCQLQGSAYPYCLKIFNLLLIMVTFLSWHKMKK